MSQELDRVVADAFGYHALQLGLPEIDGLRANRMPHRWFAHAVDACPEPAPMPPPADEAVIAREPRRTVTLCCSFDALPFPSGTIDLAVLPHTLESARDPHATLAEVDRVLVPEGRVVIIGFNPASLWGLRQWIGWGERLAADHGEAFGQAHVAEFLGYRRVRDWLRLLSFDIEGGRFGLWRPPLATQAGLDRLAWMDRIGSHWWPVMGGAYAIVAVKRVRGMRLVGVPRRAGRRVVSAPAVVAQRRRDVAEEAVP